MTWSPQIWNPPRQTALVTFVGQWQFGLAIHPRRSAGRPKGSCLQRQLTLLINQRDRLVNLLIAEGIDQETHARKGTELRDKIALLKLQLVRSSSCSSALFGR